MKLTKIFWFFLAFLFTVSAYSSNIRGIYKIKAGSCKIIDNTDQDGSAKAVDFIYLPEITQEHITT